jgi:hypothetical protein
MPKKELLFFSTVIILGVLDWATTVFGILLCGASEANLLLIGMTQSSLVLFSVVKLSAVVIVGLLLYKAVIIGKTTLKDWKWSKNFVNCGYFLTFLTLSMVVASNLLAIFLSI